MGSTEKKPEVHSFWPGVPGTVWIEHGRLKTRFEIWVKLKIFEIIACVIRKTVNDYLAFKHKEKRVEKYLTSQRWKEATRLYYSN